MSTFQFKLELVPSHVVTGNDGGVAAPSGNCGSDVAGFWRDHQPASDVEMLIEAFLPRGVSWHDDQVVFGNVETTDIQIWKNKEDIERLSVKIDLREPSRTLREGVVNLAKKLDCWILVPESGSIFEPHLSVLNEAIKVSAAFEALSSPTG